MRKTIRAFGVALAVILARPAVAAIPEAAGVPSLAPMLNEITPGVVNIAVRSRALEASDNPLLNDPFFRRFFNAPKQRERHTQAPGSRLIAAAAPAFRLTNNHAAPTPQPLPS